MRASVLVASLVAGSAVVIAAAAGLGLPFPGGSEARAQAVAPAPCVCSRPTPIAGGPEPSPVAGQSFPRFGIAHCQCGALTCVSQIPYASGGVHQIACVK